MINESHHFLLQTILRPNQSRRIRIHNLVVLLAVNPEDTMPRCLRFGRRYTELAPQQLVQQGRFSRVRFADDTDKS